MPDKKDTEQAKQGAIQYAKAWGGMSTYKSKMIHRLKICVREPNPTNAPCDSNRGPAHATIPDTTYALSTNTALLHVLESQWLQDRLCWTDLCVECCISGACEEAETGLRKEVWRERPGARRNDRLVCGEFGWWRAGLCVWRSEERGHMIAYVNSKFKRMSASCYVDREADTYAGDAMYICKTTCINCSIKRTLRRPACLCSVQSPRWYPLLVGLQSSAIDLPRYLIDETPNLSTGYFRAMPVGNIFL